MDDSSFDESASETSPGAVPGGPIEKAEGAAKRFVLAGIGAVAAACDTAEDQYDRFVLRGQRAQEEWQERADEVRRQNTGARMRFGDFLRSSMDTFLNTVNVPSKGDIDTINVKLNILSRKLDDLQIDRIRETENEPPASPGTAPAPPSDLGT